jgi:hypothetical protein
MKLRSSKAADSMHQKNVSQVKLLMERYKDPGTSQEDRNRILEKFRAILDHVDGKVRVHQESIFLRMVKFTNGKHE